MSCTDEQGPQEIGAAKWTWLAVPLAGFAYAAQLADATSMLFSNLSFGVGAHMNYRRKDEDAEPVEGPIFEN